MENSWAATLEKGTAHEDNDTAPQCASSWYRHEWKITVQWRAKFGCQKKKCSRLQLTEEIATHQEVIAIKLLHIKWNKQTGTQHDDSATTEETETKY